MSIGSGPQFSDTENIWSHLQSFLIDTDHSVGDSRKAFLDNAKIGKEKGCERKSWASYQEKRNKSFSNSESYQIGLHIEHMKEIFKTRQVEIHSNKARSYWEKKRGGEYDTLPPPQLLCHAILQIH